MNAHERTYEGGIANGNPALVVFLPEQGCPSPND